MSTRIKKIPLNIKGKIVCIVIDKHRLYWRIIALVEGEMEPAITLTNQIINFS